MRSAISEQLDTSAADATQHSPGHYIVAQIVPPEILDAGAIQSCIPGFGADLRDRLPPKAEDVRCMLAQLLLDDQSRLHIQRHGNRLARLGLVGMNPCEFAHKVHLRPLQPGDIRLPQTRGKRERRHVRHMLGKLGQ